MRARGDRLGWRCRPTGDRFGSRLSPRAVGHVRLVGFLLRSAARIHGLARGSRPLAAPARFQFERAAVVDGLVMAPAGSDHIAGAAVVGMMHVEVVASTAALDLADIWHGDLAALDRRFRCFVGGNDVGMGGLIARNAHPTEFATAGSSRVIAGPCPLAFDVLPVGPSALLAIMFGVSRSSLAPVSSLLDDVAAPVFLAGSLSQARHACSGRSLAAAEQSDCFPLRAAVADARLRRLRRARAVSFRHFGNPVLGRKRPPPSPIGKRWQGPGTANASDEAQASARFAATGGKPRIRLSRRVVG